VSAAAGSYPHDDAARRRAGAYLIQSQLQSSGHTCALFLTGSAQNLLCLQLAEAAGVDLGTGGHFFVWSAGALVPGLVGTLLTPYLVARLQPPTVTETPDAPRLAAARLDAMGPLTQDEWVVLFTVGGALVLWVFGEALDVPPVVAALLALAALNVTGVLEWRRDCLAGAPQAWDTLFWFCVVISMSLALQDRGVTSALAGWAGAGLEAIGGGALPWPALFALLHVQFLGAHYLFASKTAHVGALYTAFLSLMVAGGECFFFGKGGRGGCWGDCERSKRTPSTLETRAQNSRTPHSHTLINKQQTNTHYARRPAQAGRHEPRIQRVHQRRPHAVRQRPGRRVRGQRVCQAARDLDGRRRVRAGGARGVGHRGDGLVEAHRVVVTSYLRSSPARSHSSARTTQPSANTMHAKKRNEPISPHAHKPCAPVQPAICCWPAP
jgi:hypothetical protein